MIAMGEHGNNNTNKVRKRKWEGLTYPLKVEKWSSKKKKKSHVNECSQGNC